MSQHLEISGVGSVVFRKDTSNPPAGLVAVDVEYVGLCASDVSMIRDAGTAPGTRFGHEVVGIVQPGPGVEAGRFVVQTSEGFAERVFVAQERLVSVPEGLPAEIAVLAEPVACAVLAVERSVRVEPPTAALVIGAGFMGLVVTRLLVARGLRVTVVDPDPLARDRALTSGAAQCVTANEHDELAEIELVFECVGTQEGLSMAVAATGVHSVLSIVGYHATGGGKRTVDMRTLNYRGVEVVNAHERRDWVQRAGIARALALLTTGTVDATMLGSQIINMADVPAIAAGPIAGKYIVRMPA